VADDPVNGHIGVRDIIRPELVTRAAHGLAENRTRRGGRRAQLRQPGVAEEVDPTVVPLAAVLSPLAKTRAVLLSPVIMKK
jgi:hypothetical protein